MIFVSTFVAIAIIFSNDTNPSQACYNLSHIVYGSVIASIAVLLLRLAGGNCCCTIVAADPAGTICISRMRCAFATTRCTDFGWCTRWPIFVAQQVCGGILPIDIYQRRYEQYKHRQVAQ
ncbi:hypothetical protein TTRE_0000058601 [Trichuris trichiura]|uniref:Uncharacterized protein n=1 Tax=Trichuris trichiura TaxID=36087 RepID=A0A077YWA5_TRITR|nr:hypothetical protein TTRE_0000058601 [Trichuris trichiura]